MPTDVPPFGIGIIDTGPFGRHLLERLSLRRDFTAADWWSPCSPPPWLPQTCTSHSTTRSLLEDSRSNVVYLTGPAEFDLLAAAISSKKHLVLQSIAAVGERDLERLAQLAVSQGTIAVLDEPRRWDEDFLGARSAVDRGCLGNLTRLRLAIHERSLPGEEFPQGVLRELGWHWLDQLLALVDDVPQRVQLRTFADAPGAADRGFLAVIDFAGGASAVVELQTRSLLSLRTGWWLEGTTGAYRGGRCYSLSPDDEIIDEPVPPPSLSSDPFFEALAAALHGDGAALARLPQLPHATRIVRLVEALEQSISDGVPRVELPSRPHR